MATRRTFPPPWTVHEADEAWRVVDSTGFAIVWFCWGRETTSGTWPDRMTKDEARRMAVNFADLPELLMR